MYEELAGRMRKRADYLYNASRFYDGDAEDAALLYKAADAIEELQKLTDAQLDIIKQYQGYLTKHRWIPVTERLPEVGVAVLVTYLGYNDGKKYSNMTACYSDWGWHWWEVEDEVKVTITHWMPLPESPKEET